MKLSRSVRRSFGFSRFSLGVVTAALSLSGCADEPLEHQRAPDAIGSIGEGLTISCAQSTATGYTSGNAFTITVVHVDGKPMQLDTANAYWVMATAAKKDGIALQVVSGFRTMAEQQYLYGCYVNCNCNGCNLAAKPGYSNHQSGHAVDLNTSSSGVYSWLSAHADEYGFKRTVPSEIWHWEYWGSEVGGSCTSSAPPAPSSSGCYSNTLGREVVENTCVQSRSDSKWYQCLGGNKWDIRWGVAAACVSEHPL